VAVAALALFLVAGALSAVPAEARKYLDIRVFARVPNPGQPEPVAIGPPHRRVYVGTNQQSKGDSEAPSVIFAYNRRGQLIRRYVVRGQPLEENHGIQGLAFDGRGRLYALDRSANPRVVLLNPRTRGQRTYATFRDVPSCMQSGLEKGCSDTTGPDLEAAPNFAAFAPDGRLYVTDIQQALIWRVPRGGGKAKVWFTDQRLENIFGPNGIQFLRSGRSLMFASTASSPSTGDPTSGALYTLRVRRDGSPAKFKLFWRSNPFDGPDGFALARSGRVYLALAGANQLVVISPKGNELARVPATPAENAMMDPPFNGPASVAFLRRRVLVTNQTDPLAGDGNPDHWAVFNVFAGERKLPLFRPVP
jgi:sugar lactone lactonase YvrE